MLARALAAFVCLGAIMAIDSCDAADAFPPAAELPSRHALPDPLTMFQAGKVSTKDEWTTKRRPELKALFQHYMYGFAPDAPPAVVAKVEREDKNCLGGKATKQEVTLTFGPKGTPPINLLVILPNGATGPVPVFAAINFCGNHTVLDDPTIAIPKGWIYNTCPGCADNKAGESGRGKQADVWNVDLIVARGYGLAVFYSGDVDPDHPDFNDGVHAAYKAAGRPTGANDWGTIRAWAWGLSRVVDYLVTRSDVEKSQIVAVGHSRLGKTVLLAAALDERIALVIPHQAGCGGTAPSRGKVGESVQRINTSFPHWFNDEFPKFNEDPTKLPFDQHCLIALCAPRPVLLSNAQEDQWANPDGQFEMLVAADPVYQFLGVDGLKKGARPESGQLIDSPLGYYIRPGKHSMNRDDWKVFLDFADKNLTPVP